MTSVSGVYLNCILRLNLNEYQDDIRIWSVSVLYQTLNLNEYQDGVRIWSVSELYLEAESE